MSAPGGGQYVTREEFTNLLDKIKGLLPEQGQYLSAKQVNDLHRNADTQRPESIHHKLGRGKEDAKPGDTDASQDLSSVVFSGSRSSATAAVLAQVLTALTKFGASDATSA